MRLIAACLLFVGLISGCGAGDARDLPDATDETMWDAPLHERPDARRAAADADAASDASGVDGDVVCEPLDFDYLCAGHIPLGSVWVAPTSCGFERLDTRTCLDEALRTVCPESIGSFIDLTTDFGAHEVVVLRASRYGGCDSCGPGTFPDALRIRSARSCGDFTRVDYACEREICGVCDISIGLFVQLVRVPRIAGALCLEEHPPSCAP